MKPTDDENQCRHLVAFVVQYDDGSEQRACFDHVRLTLKKLQSPTGGWRAQVFPAGPLARTRCEWEAPLQERGQRWFQATFPLISTREIARALIDHVAAVVDEVTKAESGVTRGRDAEMACGDRIADLLLRVNALCYRIGIKTGESMSRRLEALRTEAGGAA